MPRVKVRHGAITYKVQVGDREVQENAFRGMVVDLSESEADRLRSYGAVVDADAELSLPGRLAPIPNTASDEELISWASVANKSEIAAAIADRPEIGDRLRAAADVVKRRLEAQNELLGGLDDVVKEGQQEAKKRQKAAEKRDKAQRGGNRTPAKTTPAKTAAASGGAGDDDDEEDDIADVVLQDDPNKVVEFVAENPHLAAQVLEAENERAKATNGQPRDVVVKAVEAAASHSA